MTEAARIQAILAGHTEEYAYFLDRYTDAIHRMVAGIVDCAEDAEEVTQDAFVRAYEKLPTFRGDCQFSTWLYRIAYRLALRCARKPRRELLFDGEEALDALGDEVSLPVDSMAEADDDQVEHLREAIGHLRPEERTLLLLAYDEERPTAEIAAIMGLSEGNIRTRLSRLRKKLFLLLSHEPENPRTPATSPQARPHA